MEEKFNHMNDALLLDDAATIIASLRDTNVNVAAAVKFVEGGPRTLEELRVSDEDMGFPSMKSFEKREESEESDAADLEKRFGRRRKAANIIICASRRSIWVGSIRASCIIRGTLPCCQPFCTLESAPIHLL
jgi:hypothetical protein